MKLNPPVFSKTLKKAQAEFNKIHNFLIGDPLVKETLFTSDSRLFKALRIINIFFSFVVFIPIIATIWDFNLPHFLGYLLCAFGVYLTWVFEWTTKSPILEEIRTLQLYRFLSTAYSECGLNFTTNLKYTISSTYNWWMWLVFLIFPLVIGIELLSADSKSPFFSFKIIIITLTIVTTLGVFWEIGEFISDLIFRNYPGYRLAQEDSLFDTMTDFIANLIGTITGLGVFWMNLKKLNKSRDMDSLFERMGKALKDYVNQE